MKGSPIQRFDCLEPSVLSKIVDDIFTTAFIVELGEFAALPKYADMKLFGSMTKTAASFYLLEVSAENENTVNREVGALRDAALDCDRGRVEEQLNSLSVETERLFKNRCDVRRVAFPTNDDLSNAERAKATFALIVSLTLMKGGVIKLRDPPPGAQSQTRVDVLFAPTPSRNFDKRSAERAFVRRMRAAWRWSVACDDSAKEKAISDSKPARSASRTKPGPFVHLIKSAFEAIGTVYPTAKFVDAVRQLIGYTSRTGTRLATISSKSTRELLAIPIFVRRF